MAARVPPPWVVGPLLATRNAIARVHRALVPPPVTLLERTLGIVDTQAVAVAAELGVADPGRVLVLEQLVPGHAGDHLVKAVDLEMLVDTGAGRERTRAEFERLFARAGLRVERIRPIAVSSLFELAPDRAGAYRAP